MSWKLAYIQSGVGGYPLCKRTCPMQLGPNVKASCCVTQLSKFQARIIRAREGPSYCGTNQRRCRWTQSAERTTANTSST
eukprot:4856336-Amphidinium_carterae.1